MTNNTYISEEIMQGNPLTIENILKVELANQLLQMSGSTYENVCNNMKIYADVFEILEEHINDDMITLKYNPMGAWYIESEDQE